MKLGVTDYVLLVIPGRSLPDSRWGHITMTIYIQLSRVPIRDFGYRRLVSDKNRVGSFSDVHIISFAARVFDSDLGGLVTKEFNIDFTQSFSIIYRVELVVEVSNTYLAKSKGLLR